MFMASQFYMYLYLPSSLGWTIKGIFKKMVSKYPQTWVFITHLSMLYYCLIVLLYTKSSTWSEWKADRVDFNEVVNTTYNMEK